MSLTIIPIVFVVVFVAGLVKTAFDVKNGKYEETYTKKTDWIMDPWEARGLNEP
ncbi:MAG: hypothetical protein HUK04_05545 [Bacteroidaceae bacterium]|nr:hypothetical protein [Bacteroidaceae bacterium]